MTEGLGSGTMSTDPGQIAILALLWLAYFGIHSLLASLRVKQAVAVHRPALLPAYRLFFNAMAVLLILPPLWLTYAWHGQWLWRFEGAAFWLANGLALAALAGFVWTLRYYSGAEFLGLGQWRQRARSVKEQDSFHLSPAHRHVRHPWYLFGLVLLWTRDMDPMLLTGAVMITGYLFLGSRLEERKLITYYGDAYREYRRRVPGILPLPWRHLSAEQARRLVAEANRPNAGVHHAAE